MTIGWFCNIIYSMYSIISFLNYMSKQYHPPPSLLVLSDLNIMINFHLANCKGTKWYCIYLCFSFFTHAFRFRKYKILNLRAIEVNQRNIPYIYTVWVKNMIPTHLPFLEHSHKWTHYGMPINVASQNCFCFHSISTKCWEIVQSVKVIYNVTHW